MAQARNDPIGRLVDALRRLPGIGEKTGTRLAYFLLAAPQSVALELGEAILRLRSVVVLCEECFDLTDASPYVTVTGADFSLSEGARLFAVEAGGGVLVGLFIGWLGFRALASMDEYTLEVLITLAIVIITIIDNKNISATPAACSANHEVR